MKNRNFIIVALLGILLLLAVIAVQLDGITDILNECMVYD
ncbi:hypothetical protein SAMN05216383_1203 [Prevotella sp. KH2C16]|nr:hypothetical protein SAMN05216383_1203 [Prevotella sp. KH2C16]